MCNWGANTCTDSAFSTEWIQARCWILIGTFVTSTIHMCVYMQCMCVICLDTNWCYTDGSTEQRPSSSYSKVLSLRGSQVLLQPANDHSIPGDIQQHSRWQSFKKKCWLGSESLHQRRRNGTNLYSSLAFGVLCAIAKITWNSPVKKAQISENLSKNGKQNQSKPKYKYWIVLEFLRYKAVHGDSYKPNMLLGTNLAEAFWPNWRLLKQQLCA